MSLKENISRVFQDGNKKPDKRLILVFVIINSLVLINSLIQSPEMGYDAEDHLDYITALPGHLPTVAESNEYFSPPLPYFLPSLVYYPCQIVYGKDNIIDYRNFDCRKLAGKFGQMINVMLSLGTTLLFLMIAGLIRPKARNFKTVALGLVGLLTVYYKTFAQVRGEPYVAFFAMLAIYILAFHLDRRKELGAKNATWFGLVLGLLLLSRQWGFLVFPAIVSLLLLVWLNDREFGLRFGKFLFISFAVSLIVGGWFYVHLFAEYGSFTAFNQKRAAFSLSNKPPSFYRDTGLNDLLLFKDPLRPTFNNKFIPSFYSDIWGDYWGFFVYVRDESYLGKIGLGNRDQIAPYLGTVNFASLAPSAIFLAGIFLGFGNLTKAIFRRPVKIPDLLNPFLFLILFFSFVGFLYFVITVPNAKQGDTVKATYMLHMLILLPLLGAEFMRVLESKFPRLFNWAVAVLIAVFIFNLPAMITRYN